MTDDAGASPATCPRLVVLSLGAGVQSTTLALMAAAGEIKPMPDAAIFADTQWEPRAVYDHLTWLETRLPFPVHRVTAGNIRDGILARRNTTGGRYASIPWFTLGEDGSKGMGQRQCSSEYKLAPIMWKVRELLGVDRRAQIKPGSAEIWIGISTDEAHRMKPARQAYMTNRWPLIDAGMSRDDCLKWMSARGFPKPPKSACIGCPYHDQDYWRNMRDNSPAEWADAVEVDRQLRLGNSRGLRAIEFMHPQRVPLDQADLTPKPREPDLFGNECEGICGV